MVSPGREYDRKILSYNLEILAVALRTKQDTAYLNEEINRLKTRIATFDYSKIDREFALVSDKDRKWRLLTSNRN